MKEETKKEVLKLIEEVAQVRKEISDLEEERKNAVGSLDKKLQEKYQELEVLCEKKRLALLADDTVANPTTVY
jgi:predicted nuclease with TOPRIM domain